jgi:phosphoglycolate phosphatase-like HAD superfamily hydrolase
VHDKLEGINTLLKNKNLDLKNTFFIGDSNHETEVSKKVGIKSVAVTWGFNNEQKLKSGNPDFLVHNVAELEKIIL